MAGFQSERDRWSLPFYEFTAQLATLEPPPPELQQILDALAGGADEPDALAAYQAARDALSGELFDAIDVIAGHGWTDDEIGGLLLRMNAAMGDEVDALAQLPPLATTAA